MKTNPHLKRILNCNPSRDTQKDWQMDHAVAAGLMAAAPPIPASKDLRETWWSIGNQLQTGSCVGWATADGLLRWHFVKAGKIQKTERLSPRFIWMAAKETDAFTNYPTTFIELEGTSLKAALDIARKFGSVKNSVLAFDGKLYADKTKTFYTLASQLKIASYINLGSDTNAWKNWLANHGPILVRLDVDDTWYNAQVTKGNLDVYHPPPQPAGHAVALVGYTPDRFIVRNSWGTATWGDKGFGYASTAYAQAAFTEAYGVNV